MPAPESCGVMYPITLPKWVEFLRRVEIQEQATKFCSLDKVCVCPPDNVIEDSAEQRAEAKYHAARWLAAMKVNAEAMGTEIALTKMLSIPLKIILYSVLSISAIAATAFPGLSVSLFVVVIATVIALPIVYMLWVLFDQRFDASKHNQDYARQLGEDVTCGGSSARYAHAEYVQECTAYKEAYEVFAQMFCD